MILKQLNFTFINSFFIVTVEAKLDHIITNNLKHYKQNLIS